MLGITFVFGLFFLLATFVPVSYSGLNDKITGWSWSPLTSRVGGKVSGYGLTSYNDCYYDYTDTEPIPPVCLSQWSVVPPNAPYGLTIDFPNNELKGWAWNQGVGWICFGSSCCVPPYDYCSFPFGTPDGNPAKATYDITKNPSPISGWAKIISRNNSTVAWGDRGWIALRGKTQDGLSEYGLTFSTTTLEINGLAWNGFDDAGLGDTGMGSYHGYGWLCINATSSFPGMENLCCFKENPVTGECETSGLQVNIPFIKTDDGDVYSQYNISPDLAPTTGYNATYLILAGGNIANFTSEEKYKNQLPDPIFNESYVQPDYTSKIIGIPKKSTNFFNTLGYLDVPGISFAGENKYGLYEDLPAGDKAIDSYYTKAGYRVIIHGDLILGKNAPVIFGNGPITFIVNGDLIIMGNVRYSQNVINSFQDLPSVAYIVRGDVKIAPTVEEVAGNFIVIGQDNKLCSDLSDIGCGIIDTVDGADSDDKFTLTVHGIMMAKKFKFQRSYASVLKEPSEKVIYDGRLLVNPPPGLADFSKGLPIWLETSPQ